VPTSESLAPTGGLAGCWPASAFKACFAADLGFKEIHVKARLGDVMAGAGGEAGPAPDVRHQPPGKTVLLYLN